MTTDDALLDRYLSAWAQHDEQALRDMLAPDVVAHGPGLRQSVEGADEVIASFANPAFRILDIKALDSVRAGDRLAVRYVARFRQTAEILGIPPGDREITEHGMQFLRLHAGRIAELWTQNDQVGFLGQVGIRELPDGMLVGTQ